MINILFTIFYWMVIAIHTTMEAIRFSIEAIYSGCARIVAGCNRYLQLKKNNEQLDLFDVPKR